MASIQTSSNQCAAVSDKWSWLLDLSLVPRPSAPPVFDRLLYAGEGLGSLLTCSTAQPSYVVYQQSKTCTRLILHSALATKMGQVPTDSYTKHMKHAHATSHDSKGCRVTNVKTPSYDAIFLWSKRRTIWSFTPCITALSPFTYCKRSKTGGVEGLGTRPLVIPQDLLGCWYTRQVYPTASQWT